MAVPCGISPSLDYQELLADGLSCMSMHVPCLHKRRRRHARIQQQRLLFRASGSHIREAGRVVALRRDIKPVARAEASPGVISNRQTDTSLRFDKDLLLKDFSTWGIGGPADFLIRVTTEDEMAEAFRYRMHWESGGLRTFSLCVLFTDIPAYQHLLHVRTISS